MRRIFGQVDLSNGRILLSPEEEKHLRVIRVGIGEELEILSLGKAYRAVCRSYKPYRFELVSREPVPSRELGKELILLLPLLKKDHFEFCLQKGTELGVTRFVPFVSKRVIKRISSEEFGEKRPRFEKILEEAVEQSNRTDVPVLDPLKDYKDALLVHHSAGFIAYEDEALKGIKISLAGKDSSSVAYLFGPEGGFAQDEVEHAVGNGFIPVKLGKRILRAETAAVYGLSVLAYFMED
jgi:16S rRNA (uracil1498-N3)-methyltransferase